MRGPRITKLADGEELISFEVEHSKTLVDDPRQELLEHRRAAEGANETSLDMILRDVWGDMSTQQSTVDPVERPAPDHRLDHREHAMATVDNERLTDAGAAVSEPRVTIAPSAPTRREAPRGHRHQSAAPPAI